MSEIGQLLNGQPYQRLACPEWLKAYLMLINSELERVMWNIHQEEYESPFFDQGVELRTDAFHVDPYSWDDEPQPYNFKWRDVEISWYKHFQRGASLNRAVTHDEGEQLLMECLESVRKMNPSPFRT